MSHHEDGIQLPNQKFQILFLMSHGTQDIHQAGRCSTSLREGSGFLDKELFLVPCLLERQGLCCNNQSWCSHEVIAHLNSTVIASFTFIKQYILTIFRVLFVLILRENLKPDGKQLFLGYYIFLESYWRDELHNDIL